MARASYNDIGGPTGHLARLEPFKGNSIRGGWRNNLQGVHKYYVWSYATIIASYDPVDGHVDVPDRKYSVTTSRHQNLCRAWLGRARHVHGV